MQRKTQKIYLDNDVFSTMEKQDMPTEASAIDKLLEHHESGKIRLVTSQVTQTEIDRLKEFPARSRNHKILTYLYRLMEKVPYLDEQKLLAFQSNWTKKGGVTYPIMEDDPTWKELRLLGVSRTDAHHLMLAIKISAMCS
jgi:hypothetical protein